MELDAVGDRKRRKEEGKKLKRQQIMESGGKRPRKESKATRSANDADTQQKKTSRSKQSNTPRRHNFGRVMEQIPCRNRPRFSTVSIAIPGSVVANCQTREQKTQIAGQLARAATIYHVDEIVVYDDNLSPKRRSQQEPSPNSLSGPNALLARILQFCECPQYLRRHFFPVHPDLQFVGMLAPIDAPHHVRAEDRCKYREGLVMEKRPPKRQGEPIAGSFVNCGVKNRPVLIEQRLKPGVRCTVRLESYNPGPLRGTLVSPRVLTETDGTYWGYTVRMAGSLQAIWDECPYPDGYDLKIGTSERGSSIVDDPDFQVCPSRNYDHSLIVFGGVAGIEECVDADESLRLSGSLSHSLFHTWVNVCPFQGSRTIRTEEAVLITLAKLSPHLLQAGKSKGKALLPTKNETALSTAQDTQVFELRDSKDISDESSDDEVG